ncbi:Mitochondrial distribution and morphology protein 12 [Dissophora globulifera]|uniref:Mitochondrial distribution and morphology protein 12 n=1 Tax=Dissophora globulifera TaxID=979702 RepID=A0A9P6RF51_9FUNG|nr:Mitochondrial distribution and morphology protein 12 [Dissophora globulifera]
MSFVFAWEKLDDEVALQIETMIHNHFQRIPKPSFMGNLAVSKFRFGSTPPSITVLDVTDPLQEWYIHMDQEEARLAQEAADAGGGESLDEGELASGDEYEDDYSYSADGSIVMVGEGDDTVEYLQSRPFDDGDQLDTEAWLRRQQGRSHGESSSSDSLKDERHNLHLRGTHHAQDGSDDDIESEAFYTQGESTIYHGLKAMRLEHSNSTSESPRPASTTGADSPRSQPHHPQLGNALFTSTSGGPNGNMNMSSASLGLGFGAGIGSSPGSVLSTVIQNRAAGARPLSSASFYSSPTSVTASSQLHFPDLSGMVSTGTSASVLGLRTGTPTRTIPSTPRGFESPTLAFSRRPSFSEASGDDSHAVSSVIDRPTPGYPGDMQSREQDHDNPALFMSPVEALNFDAFSRHPTVVERLKDSEMAASSSRNGSQSGRSNQGDQPMSRSNSNSARYHRHHAARPERDVRNLDKQRQRKREETRGNGYDRGDSQTPASFSPSPMPIQRHENDIQLLLSVNYQGQMGFTVETELLLNYPTFAFLALPVKLVITGFSFKAKVMMGYLRNHVNVCFLEPEDPNESILSNVRIESQVGDEQKQAVLKNVGKIERFVVEQLRKFITEDFVYPSYHSIELQRPPPSSQSVSHATSSVQQANYKRH